MVLYTNFKRSIAKLLFFTNVLFLSSCYHPTPEFVIPEQYLSIQKISTGYSGDLVDLYFEDTTHGSILGDYDFANKESIILRSIDGGSEWIIDSLHLKNFKSYAIGGFKERIFLAVSDLNIPVPAITQQVLFSDDHGASWNHYGNFSSLPVFTNDAIAVRTQGHLTYRTSDGGASWKEVLSINYQTGGTIERAAENLFLYGGNAFDNSNFGFLFRSTDEGATWLESSAHFNNITSLNFVTDSVGFAFDFSNQLLKTTDSGATFKLVNSSILTSYPASYFYSASEGIYATANSIYYTSDGGVSWKLQYTDPIIELNSRIYYFNERAYCIGKNGIILRITKK